uniref:C2H2-type domain-containing protein n=1 Tax=Nelumbo nucifera TaxID=4432 RepID=A0A822XLZ1_NELNU|nr:TPA_asm: hypothetical protein HUJ06_021429 [Nelumbo nucifera]
MFPCSTNFMSPCEHAFCLDCARSDSSCYLCDERIQKIQTIKMMEGIFICAAPHCLKSFLKRSEFESHIHESHADLLQPNIEKEDVNESDAFNAARLSTDSHAKLSIPADSSTSHAQPRPVSSLNSNSQPHDREDKARRLPPREPPKPIMQPKPPSFYVRPQNHPPELSVDNNSPQVFDRPGAYGRFHHQQSFDTQSGPHYRRDSDAFPDKQQGVLSEPSFSDYPPMHTHQLPGFVVPPVNANQAATPPPFNYPPFPAEGPQPFFNAPYETARTDLASEGVSDQGSLLGFPPGPAAGVGFNDGYAQPWNMGLTGLPVAPLPGGGQGVPDGFPNPPDSQGRVAFFQGDYGRFPGGKPLNAPPLPPPGNKGLEPMQGGSALDHKDSKGILAPQPLSLPPPPPPPPHLSQLKRAKFSGSGDMGWDGQGYGWQNEKRDSFGSGQE